MKTNTYGPASQICGFYFRFGAWLVLASFVSRGRGGVHYGEVGAARLAQTPLLCHTRALLCRFVGVEFRGVNPLGSLRHGDV